MHAKNHASLSCFTDKKYWHSQGEHCGKQGWHAQAKARTYTFSVLSSSKYRHCCCTGTFCLTGCSHGDSQNEMVSTTVLLASWSVKNRRFPVGAPLVWLRQFFFIANSLPNDASAQYLKTYFLSKLEARFTSFFDVISKIPIRLLEFFALFSFQVDYHSSFRTQEEASCFADREFVDTGESKASHFRPKCRVQLRLLRDLLSLLRFIGSWEQTIPVAVQRLDEHPSGLLPSGCLLFLMPRRNFFFLSRRFKNIFCPTSFFVSNRVGRDRMLGVHGDVSLFFNVGIFFLHYKSTRFSFPLPFNVVGVPALGDIRSVILLSFILKGAATVPVPRRSHLVHITYFSKRGKCETVRIREELMFRIVSRNKLVSVSRIK